MSNITIEDVIIKAKALGLKVDIFPESNGKRKHLHFSRTVETKLFVCTQFQYSQAIRILEDYAKLGYLQLPERS